MSKGSNDLSGIEQLRRQVERWRGTRRRGQAMPERLWAAAGKLAQRHGVWPTARALGLTYAKLKHWARAGEQPRQVRNSAAFMELIAPALPGLGAGCRIELEGPAGVRLKMEVPVASCAAVVQELWQVVRGTA